MTIEAQQSQAQEAKKKLLQLDPRLNACVSAVARAIEDGEMSFEEVAAILQVSIPKSPDFDSIYTPTDEFGTVTQ